jgi:hypothetical protein
MKITFFVTYLDRIHNICSSYNCDLTLVAQVSSHCVRYTVKNRDCETNFTNMHS